MSYAQDCRKEGVLGATKQQTHFMLTNNIIIISFQHFSQQLWFHQDMCIYGSLMSHKRMVTIT